MRVILIRHGATAGNLKRRYIGRTDEPLCEAGIEAVRAAASKIRAQTGLPQTADALHERDVVLAVSPMRRCRQTASILFPDLMQTVVDDFRECDFGAFEGRSADEMTGDPDFQRWIDANAEIAFPGGEDPAAFKARVCRAFVDLSAGLRESSRGEDVPGGALSDDPGNGSDPEAAGDRNALPDSASDRTLIIAAHGGTIMAILERYAVPYQAFYKWHAGNAQGYAAQWDGSVLTDVTQVG